MKEPAAEIRFRKETPYGLLEVRENKEIRWLVVDGRMESAIYTDARRDHKLVFPTCRDSAMPLQSILPFRRHFWLAAVHFLIHLLSFCLSWENNWCCRNLARDSAGRSDIFWSWTASSPRLHIYQKDGFQYLFESSEKYDLIINDAFIGQSRRAEIKNPPDQ